MLFFLARLYVMLYLIRPYEFSGLERGTSIIYYVGLLGSLVFCFSLLEKRAKIMTNGTDQAMAGFVFAQGMSLFSQFWIAGGITAMQGFLPVLMGYFIVTHSIRTEEELKSFMILLGICIVFMAIEGNIEAFHGRSFFGATPVAENTGKEEGLQMISVSRIRWFGVFEDPNDYAMALLIMVPFLINLIVERRHLFIASVMLPVIVSAIIFTNSRGAMLGIIVSTLTYVVLHKKNIKGVLWLGGISILIIMAFAPSRFSGFSASDVSAHGRIEAWYEGYQMFKSSPLFGVGKGAFEDFNELTAHNSFVLVLAELGLFGSFYFIGLFYFPLSMCYRYLFKKEQIELSKEDEHFRNALFACFFGLMTTMFFLSRSYVFTPYLVIGLCSAVFRIYNVKYNIEDRVVIKGSRTVHIFGLTIVAILFVNIVIKIFI